MSFRQQQENEEQRRAMSVYAKLSKARAMIHSQGLKKTGHNKFAGYSYFELGDFIEPAIKVFDQIGLCGILNYTPETATLTIVDTESGGEIIFSSPMSTAALKGCHEVQNMGAVQTYLRRYLWVMALEIVESDALDATTGKDDKEPKKIPEQRIADMIAYITEADNDEEKKARYKAAMEQCREEDDVEAAKRIKAGVSRGTA